MIFNIIGHINMIRNGLFYDLASKPEFSEFVKGLYPPRYKSGTYPLIIKTQSRRPNRGIYQIGKDYAVQPKRGVKAVPDIRILMDKIWEESIFGSSQKVAKPHFLFISKEDAWAEGGYSPEDYEWTYRKLNPKWQQARWSRWAFEFHVIEVQTR